MASKGNNFASSSGGANLTKSSPTQSSFNVQNLGKNSAMKPSNVGQQPLSGNQQADNQNQSGQSTSNNDADALQNAQSQGNPTDQAQKELVKKAGETALSAAGVPKPVSKKIVEKAEQTGALDKINEEINKFKKKMLMKLIPALAPVIGFAGMIIIIIGAIGALLGPIAEFVEGVIQFFTKVWDVTTDIVTGVTKEREIFLLQFPNAKKYLDESIASRINETMEAEEKEKIRQEEMEKLANIWASIAAPVFFRVDGLAESQTDSDLDDGKFKDSDFLVLSSFDVCGLTYSGLSNADGSYYQHVINTTGASGIADAMEKSPLNCNNSGEWQEFLNGFANWLPVISIVHDIGSTLNAASQSENLAKTLSEHTINYKFDSAAYKNYLNNYYLDKRYSNKITEYKYKHEGSTDEDAKQFFYSNIEIYRSVYYSQFLELIKEQYNSGSSGEEDVISNLGSPYGNNSCAAIEIYDNNLHEYTESQGISSNDIYSVSDGEVISVNRGAKNLYHNWDPLKQKCICDGKVCDNYDGNEIKIKFESHGVEYIATYSNLNTINVNVGDSVTKGQLIATEGDTGCTNIKKLKFQLTSESGIHYNTNELLERCSSSSNTMSICNFNNIKINLVDCNNQLIKTISINDYVKEKLYIDFKKGIDEPELLKAGAIVITTNILEKYNYKVGINEITIQDCNYKNILINSNDSNKLDQVLNAVRGQVMTYNDKFIYTRYNLSCNRTEKDSNANSVYNTMCVNNAIKLANLGKSYQDILKIYYPNYSLNENYCLNYASNNNKYAIKNDKNFITLIEESELLKINKDLEKRINMMGYGSRAAVVEAARYLALGLDWKIPYKNGGKYFEMGINPNWADEGLDSCGFISWVLLNGGANIKETLTISKLVRSPNISGSIKINSELYKYYDQIEVGDFAYREDRIGIIIGKNDGILYIAEANIKDGLIVTTISSYGTSESNYTHIYFADNYYNGTGNVTSMW